MSSVSVVLSSLGLRKWQKSELLQKAGTTGVGLPSPSTSPTRASFGGLFGAARRYGDAVANLFSRNPQSKGYLQSREDNVFEEHPLVASSQDAARSDRTARGADDV